MVRFGYELDALLPLGGSSHYILFRNGLYYLKTILCFTYFTEFSNIFS